MIKFVMFDVEPFLFPAGNIGGSSFFGVLLILYKLYVKGNSLSG